MFESGVGYLGAIQIEPVDTGGKAERGEPCIRYLCLLQPQRTYPNTLKVCQTLVVDGRAIEPQFR